MPINREEAIRIITDEVRRIEGKYPLALHEKSYEGALGWMFTYDSKAYLETNNIIHALAGNGPLVVMKDNGEIKRFGSSGEQIRLAVKAAGLAESPFSIKN